MTLPRETSSRREGRAIFLIVLVAQILLATAANHGLGGSGALSGEAVSRAGVAADLLAGDVKGRQGLVGSLYWAPLPTLLVLPFVPLASSGFASCIVSAFVAAVAAVLLNAWWRRHGVGGVARLGGLILFEIQPPVLTSVIGGDSSLLFATLVFTSFACLLDWLQGSQLSNLAYLAVLIGLGILTRYQVALFGAAVLVIVLVAALSEQKEKGYREATLITFLTPPLYAAGVWFAANWLIMGDPTFFLRGVLPSCYVRTSLYGILTEGCEWPMALVPMLLIAATWRKREQSAFAGVMVLVIGLAGVAIGVQSFRQADRAAERRELQEITRYCIDNHDRDRVAVSGYQGYQLLQGLNADERKVFVHQMSMYLDKALEQTRGKDLYLLVPRPVGESRWEDVNLKFPHLYEGGPEIILFDHNWENWRLFRVVRTDV